VDVVTQGLLGAALSSSISKPGEVRRAAIIGFLSGLAADVDVFIRSSSDPLLTIEFHRHFTHSLLFIPFGALLVSVMLWFFFRNSLPYRRLYLFCLAGFCMSGVLDACTSYGTYLFWPFYSEPVAFRIISIIDPVFTLILLIGIITALLRNHTRAVRIGVLVAGCYLLLGGIQHYRAHTTLQSLAVERGHEPVRLIVKPSFGNILLWRGIYASAGDYYVDAVRVGLHKKIYHGHSIEAFSPESALGGELKSSTLYQDVLRFEKFSQSYLVVHPEQPDVIGDVRYAMLPNSVLPLWGIKMDTSDPEQHVTFRTFRTFGSKERQQFIDMLMGR
jgi:inner membrane protein